MVTQVELGQPATVPWMDCNNQMPWTWGFSNPQALVVAGANVWVVNEAAVPKAPYGPSLTEIKASSGDWMQTIS
jgi:hypothetical protein